MGTGTKKSNIGSTFDSWLGEEGILEEVSAKAAGRVIARQNAAATARKPPASKAAKTYSSRAMAELHENVCDLYRLGLIDKKAKRRFDAACLAPVRKPARTASK